MLESPGICLRSHTQTYTDSLAESPYWGSSSKLPGTYKEEMNCLAPGQGLYGQLSDVLSEAIVPLLSTPLPLTEPADEPHFVPLMSPSPPSMQIQASTKYKSLSNSPYHRDSLRTCTTQLTHRPEPLTESIPHMWLVLASAVDFPKNL